MTTAVDMSGAITATLQKYRTVLLTYQQQVTGDPAALRSAATSLQTDARQLTTSADAIQNGAETLNKGWTGTAYDAYHGRADQLAQSIRSAAQALSTRTDELNTQAGALESARRNVDSIIGWFDNASNQLIAAARNAAPGMSELWQSAAEQLGQQAVGLAKQVAELLGKQLVGPEVKGETLLQATLSEGHGYGESFGNGVLLSGGGYYQLGPRLSLNPDAELGKDGATVKGLEVSLSKAGAEGRISDGVLSVNGKAEADLGAKGSVDLEQRAVKGSAEAKVSAEVSGGTDNLSGKVEASADLHAKGSIGLNGVSGDIGGGASVDATGTVAAEGGGFKFDASGGVGLGLKDSAGGNLTYENGHLKIGGNITVIDGAGLKGSVNLDVDVPKVGNEIYDGATWLYNGAASAATAVGQAYQKAIQDNPGMFLP